MSKLFFDRLLDLSELEEYIDTLELSPEEREETWALVDEAVHNTVFETIFDNLPKNHHSEFLDMFETLPYEESILDWLKEKADTIEDNITKSIEKLKKELLDEFGKPH